MIQYEETRGGNFIETNESECLILPNNNTERANNNQNNHRLSRNNYSYNTCPTCKGSGKISKSETNELIALIPLSDKRLKPKRIWLWILTTVIICAIIAALLSYLFAPRDLTATNDLINLTPLNLTRIADSDNRTIGLIISFKDSFIIENKNFFSIVLKNVQLEINRNSHSIEPSIKYEQNMVVSARQKEKVDIYVDYAIYSEDDPYAEFCLNNWIKTLFSLVKTTFTFSTIWSANLQTRIDAMQYIGCQYSNNSKKLGLEK